MATPTEAELPFDEAEQVGERDPEQRPGPAQPRLWRRAKKRAAPAASADQDRDHQPPEVEVILRLFLGRDSPLHYLHDSDPLLGVHLCDGALDRTARRSGGAEVVDLCDPVRPPPGADDLPSRLGVLGVSSTSIAIGRSSVRIARSGR